MATPDPNRFVRAVVKKVSIPRPIVSPDAVDRGYWQGYTPSIPRRMPYPLMDDRIPIVPTMEREPEGHDPNTPVWLNTNCPPWICPPFWSAPVDLSYDICLPFYEQQALMGCYEVIPDHMLVIRNISYEALNAVAGDVFQFDFFIDNRFVFSIEDKFIDATAPNPAHQYALAGHTRMLQTQLVVDRNSRLCIRGMLRGPIDFNGVSPYAPGDPIISGDCAFKIFLQGFLANLRNNRDGAPRPTDLGDADMEYLEMVQQRGGGYYG